MTINEIRIDQPSADDDEYFELAGAAGEDLDDLTYIVIGDGPATLSGTIEAVVSLADQLIPDSGYFLAADTSFGTFGTPFQHAIPDLTTAIDFENNDNVTHMLVSGFFGLNGEDLDLDNDGTLDSTPWTGVVDAVCLLRDPLVMSGEHYYCGEIPGAQLVGPDATNTPGHVFRLPDGTGPFEIGFFPGPNDPGFIDTPGARNRIPGDPTGCDFDNDQMCDCADVDALVNEIANGPGDLAFDVNGDGAVDHADLDDWLMAAGALNLPSGNAYLRGDATLDGNVDGQDFVAWNDHKFTPNAAWCAGDFNADGNVDGPDFVIWNDHKFTSADAPLGAVPEPQSASLILSTIGLWFILRRRSAISSFVAR